MDKLAVVDRRRSVSLAEAPQIAARLIENETHALKESSAIVPIGDRLIVRRISDAAKSTGGIILPPIAKEKAGYGVVIAAGQGRYNINGMLIPLRVQSGAVVCFGKYSGTEVELSGVGNEDGKCLLLREEEIFFVVMEDPEAQAIRENADPPIVPLHGEDVS
jgi:chaperonin GroES